MMCFRIIYKELKDSGEDERGDSTPVVSLMSHSHACASSVMSPATPVPTMSCTVEDVLQLLRHLYVITTSKDRNYHSGKSLF